ncbi:hypothetical protein B0H17DRAFT_1197480 [Mycena rosella]|uniref:Uncharacterized protein n=1 Tax=Mycena rosella TaxID=1033263 RepID=A0AAD7DRL3_MYCRO|nr:hypothetical protein B0H17DRAFT_1197480 [Mycena rosella]
MSPSTSKARRSRKTLPTLPRSPFDAQLPRRRHRTLDSAPLARASELVPDSHYIHYDTCYQLDVVALPNYVVPGVWMSTSSLCGSQLCLTAAYQANLAQSDGEGVEAWWA